MRVTGFGRDDGDHNHAQQTASGQNQGSSGNILKYSVYTQDDCSGSPVINQATGNVVGIHTHNHCSSGYNSGTSFFNQSLWSAINPEIDLTIHQKLEDGSELTGSNVGRWIGPLSTGTFQEYPILSTGASIENVVYGNYETFRAKQDLTSGTSKEKFNNWADNSDVTNHGKFLIEYEGTTELVAQFKKTFSGITLKNEYPEVPGLNPANDVIEFKDPWLIDYEDPEYNGTTYRNRGQETSQFKSRTAPFTPDYNSYYGLDQYLGVFQNQTVQGGNYYSVRSPIQQPQDIYLTQTGKYHKFYFSNWSSSGTDNLTQNSVVNGYYESPVVFKNASASVTAVLKGTNFAGSINSFGNNSQKKLVRTNDGYLHKVYESIGHVWYERSTDNGLSWTIMNNGKPLSEYEGKSPSIDYNGFGVAIVWQEKINNYFDIMLAYHVFPGNTLYFDNITSFLSIPYEYNSTPVIAYSGEQMLVVWNNSNQLVYNYCTASFYNNPVWYTSSNGVPITSTNSNSANPTIAVRKDGGAPIFHLAWQQGNSSSCVINYCALTANSSNVISTALFATPSNGDAFNDNRNASISVITDYPTLVWEGRTYYGSSAGQTTIISKSSAGWGSSFNKYGNNVNSPTSYNGIITWSEGSQTYTDKMFRYGSIKTLSTTGKYLQLSNGPNTSSMYAVSLNNTLPYSFQTTPNIGSIAKESQAVNYCGRQGIIKKGNTQLYFTLADVSVNEEPVVFKQLPENVDVKTNIDFNSYLSTDQFNITDNSKLTFSLSYGFTDSLASLAELKNDSELEFYVELVDVNSNEIIGNTEKIRFNKDYISAIDAKTYQISTKGSGNRTVQLRIVSAANFEADYYFADILNDVDILAKSNIEELTYTGSAIITSYDLMQNYPNPFNPSTTISYQLPKDGMVTLKIYDAIGTEVTTLVNEYKPTGRYNVTFNASNLASGVYFYRLQVNDFTSSKKLILMK